MNSRKEAYSRREMLEMAAALGCLAITNPLRSVFAQEVKRQLTPSRSWAFQTLSSGLTP